MSQLNKHAESLMVGYVILIAIAIALSTGVFFYLKLYLPADKPECAQDIDLVIDSITCNHVAVSGGNPSTSIVDIKFTNKGLFNVDSAYIKIGDSERVFKTTLNDPDADRLISACNNFEIALKPGAQFCKTYTYASAPTALQEVTVEPLIWIDDIPTLCPKSIVTRRIYCT
ncbi:MAG: hypothetical protein ACP5NS_03170 [Candidatus Pacearchaeota archaeon]